MEITTTSVYHGSSIYSRSPVIRHTLQLGEIESPVPRTLDRISLADLFACLPGLRAHSGSCGAPDVFAPPPGRPFSVPHLLEHMCIELQNLAGSELGCTRTEGSHDVGSQEAVYPYEDEQVGIAAAMLGLDLIRRLLAIDGRSTASLPPSAEFARQRDEFVAFAVRRTLRAQDRALIQSAVERDIPVLQIGRRVFQFGHGRFQQRVSGTKTTGTNVVSNDLAANKDYARRLLGDLGLPVPRYERVHRSRDATDAAERIGYPVVVKPNNGRMGDGVSVGMKNRREVRAAYKRAHKLGRSVLVEEVVSGRDYRMLVIDGQLVAAAQRVPGHVVGDGERTVEELVRQVNSDPRRGAGTRGSWTQIEFDDQADRLLAELGYTRRSIPAKDEAVYLRRNANTSDGGTAVDVTDEVHPDNREIAIRAAKIIGLDVAGVDFLMPDITKSMRTSGGCILEINSRPGIRKHMWPAVGKPRDVTGPIIDMLFPPGTRGRIPVVAVTGTGDTTNTANMLAELLSREGKIVGLSTREGASIGGSPTGGARMVGPAAARMILLDPTVDVAVLETPPYDVLRHGLGYDACDVCAVVNGDSAYSERCGAETSERVSEAIRVVIGAARETVVVRGGDEYRLAVADGPDAPHVCYVEASADDHSNVRDHIGAGGSAVLLEKAQAGAALSVYDHGSVKTRVPVDRLPELTNGEGPHELQSAMFATASVFSLDQRDADSAG